jgi:hypothetical protein
MGIALGKPLGSAKTPPTRRRREYEDQHVRAAVRAAAGTHVVTAPKQNSRPTDGMPPLALRAVDTEPAQTNSRAITSQESAQDFLDYARQQHADAHHAFVQLAGHGDEDHHAGVARARASDAWTIALVQLDIATVIAYSFAIAQDSSNVPVSTYEMQPVTHAEVRGKVNDLIAMLNAQDTEIMDRYRNNPNSAMTLQTARNGLLLIDESLSKFRFENPTCGTVL